MHHHTVKPRLTSAAILLSNVSLMTLLCYHTAHSLSSVFQYNWFPFKSYVFYFIHSKIILAVTRLLKGPVAQKRAGLLRPGDLHWLLHDSCLTGQISPSISTAKVGKEQACAPCPHEFCKWSSRGFDAVCFSSWCRLRLGRAGDSAPAALMDWRCVPTTPYSLFLEKHLLGVP